MMNDLPITNVDCHADLMAGIIEHLACYIQSGRPRSAHVAALLLERLARDAAMDESLSERCIALVEVLIDQPGRQSAAVDRSPAQLSRPWLTWDRIEETA